MFFLHAVFDEKECQLYGSNLVPAIAGRDEISWIVDGEEEMHGKFIAKTLDYYFFPFICMNTLKFSGEIANVDSPSLFHGVGHHSYLNSTMSQPSQ